MKTESQTMAKEKKDYSPYKNRVFIVVLIISFLNYNSSSMLAVTLPKFADQMGASAQAVGLLTGIFAIGALLMRPISGQVVDNEDKLKMLRICIFTMLVSVFGLTLSSSYWMLIVFRGLNGLAWGIGSTLTMTLTSNCFSAKNMATGIGIYGLGQTLAQTTAPMFALPIAEKLGFNNLYYINVGLMLTCLILTLFIKVDYNPPAVKKYSVNLKNMIYFPALYPAMLTLCNSITRAAIQAFLVLFAGTMDIGNIGIFFTVQAIFVFVFRPVVSKLSDSLGSLKVLIPCEALSIIALIVIAFSKSMPMFMVAAVMMGIANAGQQPILMSESVKTADPSKRGSASNTTYIGVDGGMFIGSSMAGFFVAWFGYSNMFILMSIPALVFTIIYSIHYAKKKDDKNKIGTEAA